MRFCEVPLRSPEKTHQPYQVIKEENVAFMCSCITPVLTHPSRTLEDIENLLLSDGLVGGLRVGLGCWCEDGVDVGVN